VGEKEPIDVEIIRYRLRVKGESTHIMIEETTSSREWLTVALREFIVGQDLAVPAKAAALLQIVNLKRLASRGLEAWYGNWLR
jgi:hypothetical protein